MNYQWDFTFLAYYQSALWRGIAVTLELAVASSLLGTLAGIPLTALLRSAPIVSWPARLLTDVLRATPNLVLIFFFYYFPYEQAAGIKPLSGFAAAALAMAISQAAYSADLFRAALDQVPRHQVMGLRGLGFRDHQIFSTLTLPCLVRLTLPAHLAMWIGNIKLSSLASVIGVQDVAYVAKIAMVQSFRSLEAWLAVAAIYLIIVLPLCWALKSVENSAWVKS